MWQWGLILIGAIIVLFNFKSVSSALSNIFLVVAFGCVALAFISWFTHRPKMSTRFGIAAAICFILMYIFSLLSGK